MLPDTLQKFHKEFIKRIEKLDVEPNEHRSKMHNPYILLSDFLKEFRTKNKIEKDALSFLLYMEVMNKNFCPSSSPKAILYWVRLKIGEVELSIQQLTAMEKMKKQTQRKFFTS